MRSRYSAFARGDSKYLAATQSKATTVQSETELAAWAKSVAWVGLTVHSAAEAEVEFTARYLENGALISLREKSGFEKRDGRWIYTDGEPSVTREELERNQKCPCGSGKKFKACHA